MLTGSGGESSPSSTALAVVTNSLFVAGIWLGVRYIRRSLPAQFLVLTIEDGVIEYGSFVAWGVATLLFGYALVRAPKAQKPAFFVLLLGSFFMAMEEISWGQRILGWQGPAVLTEANLQSETNLHNLTRVGPLYRPLGVGLLAWAVIPWLLTRFSSVWRHLCDRRAVPIVAPRLWPWWLLTGGFLVLSSGSRSHELDELFLSLTIAVMALDTVATKDGPLAQIGMASVPLVAISAITVLTALAVLVFPGPRERAIANLFSQMAYDRLVRGQPSVALKLYEYVDDHSLYRHEDGQLYHGLALKAVGRTGEAQELLVGYRQLPSVGEPLVLPELEELPSATDAINLGLALCARDQQAEAKRLFQTIEGWQRNQARQAQNADQELEARFQASVALLGQGKTRQAGREIKDIKGQVRARRAKGFLKRIRESRALADLAGC